ncbi:MAG TPA: M20/M25/M40 family metallo-hydrolase [Steroidobacteraceae bacterium]|jgi:acetylornithine deacetylase/succinyl-diaminopimelate desuccinylase-like protein|nr:M20/M25/M40 family metallo-hydrolase [Steroidobacteraceae bacterium]
MKAKQKLILFAGVLSLSLVAASVATSAEKSTRGSFDAKAREIFEKVVSIPSSLGNGKVPEVAGYLAGELRAAGFPADDIKVIPFESPTDKTAMLVARYRGDGTGGKPILLLAHMDVVTANRSDWQRDPFQFIEENGYFYGRGTFDVKHGVTALTTLFLRLKAEKYVPKRDLIIFFSGDEETSQATTVAIVHDHRELIDAEYALNADGGGGLSDDATGKPLYLDFQTAEKTYADFTLTVRNPGGHSSTPGPDNAIYDLAAGLTKLAHYSFPVMWNDTTIASMRSAGKTTPGELGSAMSRFAENPRDAAAAATIAAAPNLVGRIRTTCVATRLGGGHANNALPQSATANVNCRIFPGVKVPEVQAELQRVIDDKIEIKVVGEPMSSDASPLRADVIAAVTHAVQKFHPGVPVVPQQESGATDGLVFRAAGIPTYGTDMTFTRPKDRFAHGLNERLAVQPFYDSLEMWYLMVKELAGSGKRK